MQKPPRFLALLIAIIGLVSAVALMYGLVPRIRLVEAVSLFAAAFGAGASFAVTIVSMRRQP
jgi:hypothetical protein